MSDRPTRTVAIPVLRDLMRRLLAAGGCSPDVAATVAEVFLEANMRGMPTQGLHHLTNVMMKHLLNGRTKPDGKPRILKEGEAYALIDGEHGPGQIQGLFAADVGVEKARKAGSAAIGLINGSDLFMIGYYGERMARAGCIGLAFSDSPPLVHPTGGVERIFGTNPLFVAIPTADEHPFVLDMATSAWSAGHVRHAMYHGEKVPLGVGVGPDGRPTKDAASIWKEGAISAFGGHKGYGVSFIIGVLSGLLVGATTGKALRGWLPDDPAKAAIKGHLFLAVDPAAFGDANAFRRAASAHIRAIKQSRKAPGASAILIAGDRSFAERDRSLARGSVPMFELIWQQTAKLAGEIGVAMPD